MGQEPAACIQSRLTATAIRVHLGSLEVWALVDSGADFSMVRDGLQQRLKTELACQATTPTRSAKGAGGSPLNIVEVLRDVPIQVEEESIVCPRLAVVSGLVYDVILGRDFCCQNRTIIDDEKGVIRMKGMTIPLPTYPEIRPPRARVILGDAVTLPGRSVTTVAAVVQRLDGQGPFVTSAGSVSGMMEPSRTAEREDLLIPRAVVVIASNGTIPIRLTNVGAEGVRLLKGSDVGTFLAFGGGEDALCVLCPGADCADCNVASCGDGGNPSHDPGEVEPEVQQALSPELTDLSERGRNKLRGLFETYSDVFSKRPGDIGRTGVTKHRIDTGDAVPVKQRPRRIPMKVRDQVEKQKEKMLQDGVIEESESPWCSPVVLVRKKDGSFRFCVDLRAVNAVTKGFAMPLPRIDDSLDTLSRARWFTTLDMATGYWQVELAAEDREKTAFSTGKGLHQFRVMAMGLKNASGTFQKMMELILAGLDTKSCLVYLDDVILFNRTEEEHLATLQEVLLRIQQAGLKLKAQKCRFARKEVTFLGHLVSEEGIRPDPHNVDKVLAWPQPSSEEEMKSFLGLCGYYARFIQGYAAITKPLRDAAVEEGRIRWSEPMRIAFELLKSTLSSPPVLALPTGEGTFVLYTDACNSAVGVVLAERIGDEEKVIAYESKALTKQQTRWPTYDKELWAIVHGIRHFRQYTVGARFEVVTDHKPLANIPTSIAAERDGTGRRGRWAIELSSFDFNVRIRSGLAHGNADALSRRPPDMASAVRSGQAQGQGWCPGRSVSERGDRTETVGSVAGGSPAPTEGGSPESVVTLVAPTAVFSRLTQEPAAVSVAVSQSVQERTLPPIAQAQASDATLSALRRAHERKEKPRPAAFAGWGVLRKHWSKVRVMNGVIGIASGRQFQAAVPQTERAEIIRLAHDDPSSGHMGRRRTIARVKARFVWPGMNEDIRSFCASCTPCQRRYRPAPKRRAPMVTEVTSRPFQRIAMDITEMPVSRRGNRYVLVIMDYFSKFVRIFPMPNQKTETVMEALLHWVQELGVPERLHTDQGAQFESLMMRELYQRLGIHKTRTTPYHPESDGMVERFMRTLKDMVSKYIDSQGLDWDESTRSYAMAYNSSLHETTGHTPFYMIHGFEPRLPLDVMYGTDEVAIPAETFLNKRLKNMKRVFAQVRRASSQSAARMAVRHDSKLNFTAYPTGLKVWVRDHTAAVGGKPKLGLPFKGPVTIVERRGTPGEEVTYRIQDVRGKTRVVHHNDLKEFIPRRTDLQPVQDPSGPNGRGEAVGVDPVSDCGNEHGVLLEVPLMHLLGRAGPSGDVGVAQRGMLPPMSYVTRSGRVSRPPERFQAGL